MKGMRKISRGAGFRGVCEYALDHDHGRVIAGTMAGMTARELSTEFKACRQSRPDIKKPVWHNSLRLPAGEKLTDEKWGEVAKDYMDTMGFDSETPYTVIKHDHADGEHIHIIASRVSLSGNVFYGQNENLLSTKTISEIERRHDLTITAAAILYDKNGLPNIVTKTKAVKKGEIEKALAIGEKPARMAIQESVQLALMTVKNLDELKDKLNKDGIDLKPFVKDGEIKGISFIYADSHFSGSQLGEDFKYSNLLKQMEINNYDKNRADKEFTDLIDRTKTDSRPNDTNRADASGNQKATGGHESRIHNFIQEDKSSGRPQNEDILIKTEDVMLKNAITQKNKKVYNFKEEVDLTDMQKTAGFSTPRFKPWVSPKQPKITVFYDKKGNEPAFRLDADKNFIAAATPQPDDETILAMLQAGKDQWPDGISVQGSPEFMRRSVEIADRNGIILANENLEEIRKEIELLKPEAVIDFQNLDKILDAGLKKQAEISNSNMRKMAKAQKQKDISNDDDRDDDKPRSQFKQR